MSDRAQNFYFTFEFFQDGKYSGPSIVFLDLEVSIRRHFFLIFVFFGGWVIFPCFPCHDDASGLEYSKKLAP